MKLPAHNPDLVRPTDGFWDSGASNGLRARSARSAMLHYRQKREFDSDEVICSVDLLTDLLHHLHALGENPLTCLQKAKGYFLAEIPPPDPIKLKIDTGASLKACLTGIFDEANRRQSENRGSTVLGAVMQHLVGAKLEVLYPDQTIRHSGYSVADSPTGRSGDFQIGDCVIHVTTAPGKLLIQKCLDNLDQGLRPLIVSTTAGAALAETLAEEEGAGRRVEVLDIAQYLVANMLEWTHFDGNRRRHSFEELVNRYNAIIEACETDPSLKIEVA